MFASGPGVYIVVKTETLTQINSGENQIVVYQPDETIRLDVRCGDGDNGDIGDNGDNGDDGDDGDNGDNGGDGDIGDIGG